MSVKMINDKPIAGTNSMGRQLYAAVKKGECNPMQWWLHGLLPTTENFTSAANYL